MTPHKHQYDRMYVLCAEYGANCTDMARLLQQLFVIHCEHKCAFCARYRPGPVKQLLVYFIYV